MSILSLFKRGSSTPKAPRQAAFMEMHLQLGPYERGEGTRVLINLGHVVEIGANPDLVRVFGRRSAEKMSTAAYIRLKYLGPATGYDPPRPESVLVHELLPDGREPLQGQVEYVNAMALLYKAINTSEPCLEVETYGGVESHVWAPRQFASGDIGLVMEKPYGSSTDDLFVLGATPKQYEYEMLQAGAYERCREVLLQRRPEVPA
jgi:hypothetical protein